MLKRKVGASLVTQTDGKEPACNMGDPGSIPALQIESLPSESPGKSNYYKGFVISIIPSQDIFSKALIKLMCLSGVYQITIIFMETTSH